MAEAKATSAPTGCLLPRVTIQFCTQCKWMLRAAYFAQELLSTFSVSLGEVALQPSTGGTFVVTIYHQQTGANADALSPTVLWDRKVDGGFPETKELKRRVRDVIEPGRDLGHVDRNHSAPAAAKGAPTPAPAAAPVPEPETQQPDEPAKCEDCQ
jgi:selT/selW/selH-like putative selenoprotein